MLKSMLALVLLVPVTVPEEKTFTVSGTLKLIGEVPKAKVNKALLGDPACKACHTEDPLRDDLVVDPSGGVRWGFVYVKKGLEGKKFDPPATPVVIDQVGCTYVPHMAGAMVGQTVTIRNSDPLLHNVHGLPFVNKEFNYSQIKGASNDVKFNAQEVPIRVKCDVHPWMGTWIGVLDHPFFAVTDAAGKFELKKLLPGKYTIGVWHEKLKAPDQEIHVKEDLTVEFKAQ